jgi:hypothetical protein
MQAGGHFRSPMFHHEIFSRTLVRAPRASVRQASFAGLLMHRSSLELYELPPSK